MTDVLSRCRRLGFPLFIKTNKKIGDLRAVELLWLYYYLLEIYEPAWSHSPTGFTKANYKPLASAMRLLELAHKCPKSKELKKPQEYKRSLASSLCAVVDKLEAKYGVNKLYSTRFQHPSVKGMQSNNDKKKNKTKIAANNEHKHKTNNNANNDHKRVNQAAYKNIANDEHKKTQIQIPRAKVKHLNTANIISYESKSEETEENDINKLQEEEKIIESGECDADIVMDQVSDTRLNEERKEVLQPLNDFTNNYEECDLNAYNFDAPKYNNATVKFHVDLQRNKEQLSMTQKYERLQRQQAEKTETINNMKKEYDLIAQELSRSYSFQAKSFQNTSSTDYALFQLESIKQKMKSKHELMHEKTPMDEDGIDGLLTNLSDQIQNWHNNAVM